MPGGLVALLDDIAALAKLAAASVDDVAAAASRAGVKAAGVVIDDTAVTPRYVVGLPPSRELPIIWKIALGSLRNKLLFILPAALALSVFAPWAVTPILMLGGSYLCFEASEKIFEALSGTHHAAEVATIDDPAELEARQVSGAVRTDFILSAEIMAIALGDLPDLSLGVRAAALGAVAIAITVAVYGVVALIVKMDDIGLHLSRRSTAALRMVGRGLVAAMPVLLQALSHLGVAAMVWVGGGILLHGLEEFGLGAIPRAVHHLAEATAHASPVAQGVIEWLVSALGAALAGLIVGGAIVGFLHLLPRKRTPSAEEHA
ncbi:putative DNA repair protein MutK [Sphingomonas sp. UYAg733]